MQRHEHRAEHWYILKGECSFNTIDASSDIEELGRYKEHQTLTILRKGQWHQACNGYKRTMSHIRSTIWRQVCRRRHRKRLN